jgi:ribulose-phosphate 3-epimerase
MISPVDAYLDAFAQAGADTITVHPEAGPHVHRTVQRIKSLGLRAGVALNPGTPAKMLDYLIDEVDLVLVMTVNPGFGGQTFIPTSLERIRRLRAMIDAVNPDCALEVDGGIKASNLGRVVEAGADTIVAGSSLFTPGRPVAEAMAGLRAAVAQS